MSGPRSRDTCPPSIRVGPELGRNAHTCERVSCFLLEQCSPGDGKLRLGGHTWPSKLLNPAVKAFTLLQKPPKEGRLSPLA